MKKTFSLLAALMLIVMLLPVTAMAYEATQPNNDLPTVSHTLTLTEDDMDSLAHEITYKFTVGDVEIVQPTNIEAANIAQAVTGAPSITDIKYSSDDTFDANKSCTKNLQINWSGVSIKEPGVYRWPVTKSSNDSDQFEDPTNEKPETYLFAYVVDNGGTLKVEGYGLTTNSALNDASGKGNFNDKYPINTVELKVRKEVNGTLGSKDQYFKFTVTLKVPTSVPMSYTITGIDKVVPATAYHDAKGNVTSFTLDTEGKANIDIWLKHDQTAVIEGLLYGTEYTIVESENTGYAVTSAITGDTTGTNAEGATVSDSSLQIDSKVTFTNTKNATVPTGIDLESGAPIYGMLLAMGLAIVMFIGKRKEETV